MLEEDGQPYVRAHARWPPKTESDQLARRSAQQLTAQPAAGRTGRPAAGSGRLHRLCRGRSPTWPTGSPPPPTCR
ncbi:MAG: hypothetical protein WKG07_38085 [Hymenobacter sp.]